MADCCTVKDAALAPTVMNCPGSGTKSKQVDALTVKALVRHLPFGLGKVQYYFCDAPDCDVVYFPFNPQAPSFRRSDLLVRVGAKEKSDPIPVCYCFGITRKDVRDEIERSGKSTVAERIKVEVKGGTALAKSKTLRASAVWGTSLALFKRP